MPTSDQEARRAVRDAILLEGGQRLGEVMDDWQREDLEALDDPAHRHAYLERPRGHSKTGDIGSEAVVELLAGAPHLKLFCLAADEDQARILFDDVRDKLLRGGHVQDDRKPLRRGKVRILKTTITSFTGSVLKVMTADVATAWGLRPDWIAMDEICEWRYERLWQALWTATGKRPRSRVLVISTAGWDKSHFSWGVREMAQREEDWYFSARGQCASWITPAWLAQQERSLPQHVYARLHLNQWVDGVGAFLTAAEVDSVFGDLPPDGGTDVLGLDLGLTKDLSVLARVRLTRDKRLLVHGLESWTGTPTQKVDLTEVEESVFLAAKAYHAKVWLDPFQAVQMAQQLTKRGVTVKEHTITSASRPRLFNTLLLAIREGRLRCRPHPVLRQELLGLEVKETLTGWRVDHKVGRHDDHVFAIALAAAGLLEIPEGFAITWADTKRFSEHSSGAAQGTTLTPIDQPGGGRVVGPGGHVEKYYDARGDSPRPAPAAVVHDWQNVDHRVDCRACRARWKRS